MRGASSQSRYGSGGGGAKKSTKRRNAASFLFSSSHVVYNEALVEGEDDEEALSAIEQRLDWDRVCCVLLPPQACPVCLDSPAVAPSCLPCGHCYCAACVVELKSRGLGRCLVCQGAFCLLRPARFLWTGSTAVAVGKTEQFALVVRKKDSSVVWPYAEWYERWSDGKTCARLPLVSDGASRFSKSLMAREADEVANELAAIEAHIASIADEELEREGLPNWLEAREQCQKRLMAAEALPHSIRAVVMASRKSTAGIADFVFFYQSETGEAVFLNALMSKMLMHQAKQDPLNLPPFVTCKIQDFDSFDRDEKTPKVFCHLAMSASYTCVEGIVEELSADTIKTFRDELAKNAQVRKARAAKIRARDSKFEEETRNRLMKQAKETGQPAAMLLYEEMLHDPPPMEIVESEVRHKPEKKFLSYAAVASPDGASFKPVQADFPAASISPSAAPVASKPSFADKVKRAAPATSPPAPTPAPPEPSSRGKQKYVVLATTGGGGGGRRYN